MLIKNKISTQNFFVLKRSSEQSWRPFGFSHINNQQPAPIPFKVFHPSKVKIAVKKGRHYIYLNLS